MLIPKDFPDIELDQLLRLRVHAQYVQELETVNMQKAIAKALGAE